MSCTAIQNNRPVRGIEAARIAPVIVVPNSGLPEDSSKTEPTAAIAVIQQSAKQIPLLMVIDITKKIRS